MPSEIDVVIVGGGIGGLVAAAHVARRGLSCVVLERSGFLGGRAATSVRDGFSMNLGGHALYRGGPAERALAELGVAYQGNPPALGGVAVLGAETFALPSNTWTLLRTRILDVSGKLALGRLLARLPSMSLASLYDVSLSAWLDANLADPRARAIVEMFVRLSTYANAPSRVSAGAALAQLRLASRLGVLYLDDGWQTLVDGLANEARRVGVKIATSSGIEDVSPDAAGWCVLQSDGTAWHARDVILAVGPRAAHKVLSGPAKTVLNVWADACVPAHAACLDVALRSLPRRAPTFALGVDAPLYFSVHSNAARLAPPGGAMIHAMKYLPAGHHSQSAGDERELEAWLDRLQPGWRDVTVAKRFLPSVVATNDIARASIGGARGRPGPSVPGAAGLFVVGDWVGPEGMLVDASFASAADAVMAVLRAREPGLRSEAAE